MTGHSGRALVVTVGRSRGALAAVRALGRAGWTVGIGTPDGHGMVAASRWCARRHVVPRPRGDAVPFVTAVADAVREGDYDVVFGGGDDWVAALARYRDDIPATVAHPDAEVVAASLDKAELTERARRAGLAVPALRIADADAVASWEGPVVVKCRAHWHPGQRKLHRIEARRFPDVGSARDDIGRIQRAGFDAVLQEPVEGPLGALIGLFVGGRLVGRVQQRTSRVWPTPTGVSSRAETVPVDEEVAAGVESLLAGLAWSGLAELQFLTPPGGRPHLIDLNGRFYGSMALANAAGPNLADAWARLVLGEPVGDLPDARPGVRYVWLAGDVRRAFAERRGGLARDLVSTLRWAARATESVIDVRDPGPALELSTARLRRRGSGAEPPRASRG